MKKRILRRLYPALAVFIMPALLIASPVLAESISLSASSGPVNTVISITGSGFTASAAFQTLFAYGTAYQAIAGTGTVSSAGTLTSSFNVPSVPAGTYNIRVQTSSDHATASFTVTSSINLSAVSAQVGQQVSITGTGFTAARTTVIYFDSAQVATSITSSVGTFSTSFTIPDTYSGTHTITATDSIYTRTITLSVVPSMAVSPVSGTVGTTVTISGTGFNAGRTVNVRFDNVQVATSSVSNVGKVSTTLTVPETRTGSHTITVTDGIYTNNAIFVVIQSMTISPASGSAGTTITINGTGFTASRLIRITYDGTDIATVPSAITSNNAGTFTGKFTVPAGPARTVEILASDGINQTAAYYKLAAVVELTPTSGKVGTPVTIKGSGFNASRQITVVFSNDYVSQVSTDTVGNFITIFNVPAATGGQHPVTANDGVRSISTTFTVANNMVVTPNTANVGVPITVTGSGFRGSRTVNIYFDNTVVATTHSDANGSFSVVFNAVAGTGGTHTISSNDGEYAASSNFIIQPSITLERTSGKMGEKVNITGAGFDPSRTMVVRLGTIQVKSTTTDETGSFKAEFTVPQMDIGSYNLNASDGAYTASVPFAITTSFNISPTTGYVGSTINVKGSGFDGMVTIKYDDNTVATATANPDSSFSTTFIAPISIHGFHTVTVSDGSSSLKTTYSMESLPPSTPTVLSPQSISRQNARPTFIWQGVVDASGVIYNLQVASDSSFKTIILQKEGLDTTQYTASNEEKLKSTGKDTPYYWRVQAIDLASNQSQWSNPGTFHVSFMANWLKYTLIALGSVAGALIIFYLGMITGQKGWGKKTT